MICFEHKFKIVKSFNKRNKYPNRCVWLASSSPLKSNREFISKIEDYESPDFIFDVMWYSGIQFNREHSRSLPERALRLLICILYLIGLFYSFSIRMRAFAVEDRGTMIITEMLAFTCCLFLWVSLNVQGRKIIAVSQSLFSDATNHRCCRSNNRKRRWIRILCFLTIGLPILSSAVSMFISKATKENVDGYLAFLALGFHIDMGTYYKYILLFLLRSYDLCICFVSAQMTCLLFAVISFNVSLFIGEVRANMAAEAKDGPAFYSSGRAVKSSIKVQKVIQGLEKAISMPMLFVMAFLLCELFALMSNAIHLARMNTSLASLSIVLCAIFTTGFHTIFLIFRISNVETSYQLLVRDFTSLPDENLNPPIAKELLQVLKMIAFHETIPLTAWGMFPIRRGFFLTIVGTLATYGVLLVQFT